jgi:hypothetical protein
MKNENRYKSAVYAKMRVMPYGKVLAKKRKGEQGTV